jgi:pilus assembly protein CpaB
MLALAVVFGGSAFWLSQSYMRRQQAAQVAHVLPQAPVPEAVPLATIVVASAQLRYGDELTARNLKELPWPASELPPGAFRSKAELVDRSSKRIALFPIEPNELVLQAKITGDGQRATLSALLDEGMGAVTIQVDEVIGLAGLVLPGDRVDVFATQTTGSGLDGAGGTAMNDRVLQNVRVLAVGQLADERTDKPSVVRAVTIEVTANGAQKVALAAKTGTLSLMLRRAGETASLASRRIAASEIGESASGARGDTVSVRVTRGTERTSYSVPRTEIASQGQADRGHLAREPGPGPDGGRKPVRLVESAR